MAGENTAQTAIGTRHRLGPELCHRVTTHRGDGGWLAKISGTVEAEALAVELVPARGFRISLDWKRMRNEEHSLKRA